MAFDFPEKFCFADSHEYVNSEDSKVKEEALKTGLISEKQYNKIVDPKKMVKPQ